ncbi:hypothetical protein Nepgr_008389 [Nepenthes gracilis]|uniref:Uncharacterized protein n=1 Tax=Nepenthes gracilis TaxID=150966 RepID=A0AAD3S972_NEPGR|nr:hypothetical protein Nepgr_008389 [Nepenthes gracilis]
MEYFEASDTLLCILLEHQSRHTPHHRRTLNHHAILCATTGALTVLLRCGVDIKSPITTTCNVKLHPVHVVARLNLSTLLDCLSDASCDINPPTDLGDPALMIGAKYNRDECLRVLATASVDFWLQ